MATRSQTRKKEEAKPKKEGYFSNLRRQQLEAQTKIKKDYEKKKKTAAEIKANKKLAEGLKSGVIDRRTVGEKPKKTTPKATTPKATTPKATTTTTTKAPVSKITGDTYGIKSGDTLSAIAKRAGTTVAAIMAANPSIKDKNKIQAGKSLNMPSGKSSAESDRKKKTEAETTANKKLAEGIKKGAIDRRTVGDKPKATAKKEEKKSGSSNTDSAYSSPSTPTMRKKDPETGIEREYQPRPGGKGFRNFNLKKEESKKMNKGGYANCGASVAPNGKSKA